jgi:hypothetical protein
MSCAVNIQAIIFPRPEHLQDVRRGVLTPPAARKRAAWFTTCCRASRMSSQRFFVQEWRQGMDAVQVYRAKAGEWFQSAPQVKLLSDVDVAARQP